MARTVDTSSTFENWRQNYNDLATDVGPLGNLTTGDKSSLVSAVNFIMDQYFFFQDFDFDGSDGATSNTVFSGNDNNGNALGYSAGKVLVYKNGLLLRSGTDYTAVNGTSVTLGSSANNGDVIRISAFTGSYENVGTGSTTSGNDQFLLAGGVLHNRNTGGIILNGDNSITTSPDVAGTIQLAGDTHAVGDISIKSLSSTRNELRLFDNDNSHYVALKSGATVSSNLTFTLPTADGSNGQFLKTDGSGNFSFGTVSATAPDINITANNSANETVFLTFVDGATGTQGLESDTGLTYNPSSGVLTSTTFVGALTGNASTATTLATNRNFSITGDVTASAVAFNGSGVVTLSATLDDNTVDSAELVDGSIDTSHIANGQVTLAKMAANSIDSDQYVDGSIDTAHIADNQITAAKINISGNGSSGQAILSDGDGSFSYGSSGKTTAEIQAIVGGMFSSNTETRVSATYQSGDGTIDLVVDDMTADTNTQLSDAQVRSKISGTGLISYNSSTGVISTTANNYVLENHSTDKLTSGVLPVARGGTALNSISTLLNSNTTKSDVGLGNVPNTDCTNASNIGSGTLAAARIPTLNQNTTGSAGTAGTVTTAAQGNITSVGTLSSLTLGGALSGTTATFTGDVTAMTSDERLKTLDSKIENALDKVQQINGYNFHWNDTAKSLVGGEVYSNDNQIGVSAQEIELVLPEVVKPAPINEQNEGSDYKTVQYEKIVPLLIEAIKELKTELDELKSSNS